MNFKPEKISTGIEHLDKLIDCLNVGDNVVWQMETGAFVELFCQAFVKQSLKDKKHVVLINFNNSPRNIMNKIGSIANNENVAFVDCFTSGKGDNAKIFLDLYKTRYKDYKCKTIHVEKPGDIENFIQVINKIEETYPRGTRYIIDSITGMQDLWGGDEHVMKFFTRQCPRLYELDTIAYWVMEKNAHSDQCKAQLSHITQVVIDLSIENGVCNLKIVKAENRSADEVLKNHSYEVVNSNIEFVEQKETGVMNIGRRIKDVRQKKELSQVQVAKESGVTPSTISQVENGTISLSLPALLKIASVLGVSAADLLEEKTSKPFHHIFREKNRLQVLPSDLKGIKIRPVIPQDLHNRIEAYIVEVSPGATVDSHFFVSKGNEFGFLLSGSLELDIKNRTYVLNGNDVVFFTSDVPSRWENNSEKSAKILWIVSR